MTTPICTHIGEIFKPMGNPVVQLLLVGIGLCVRFADTFRDDLCAAFLVACVFAVLALHTGRVLEEVAAHRTAHDVIKLLEHKFVTIKLMDLFFSLAYSTLPTQANVKRSFILDLFRWVRSVFLPYQGTEMHLLKLNDKCILPTGSRANHASMTPGFDDS